MRTGQACIRAHHTLSWQARRNREPVGLRNLPSAGPRPHGHVVRRLARAGRWTTGSRIARPARDHTSCRMTATAPRRPSVPPIQKWRQPRLRTKAEILAAALRWQEQTGNVPRYIDWHPLERAQERAWPLAGPTKWTAEFPAWPAAEQVQKLFGSWRHLYVQAGIDGLPPIELADLPRTRVDHPRAESRRLDVG